ncbi:RPL29 [Branchiostoma lanceolatum]|uniref:60S ribosomal protein L29 n=1 Tax=Branchiostoma lanceolatum TaxID=7740 RepID=A0A8J9ZZ19_BRALA|nr:RPL29 [Branchiostoma lanceolatum]
MAKSKNHTNHNQNKKAHRNGIKKPTRNRYESLKGRNHEWFPPSSWFHLISKQIHAGRENRSMLAREGPVSQRGFISPAGICP